MKGGGARLKFAILCDDGRREDNGKIMLIGIYGANIVIPVFPANLSLCLALFISADQEEEMPVQFKVNLNGDVITDGGGTYKFAKADNIISLVPHIPVSAPSPGVLTLEVKFGDADWVTAVTIPLEKRAA